MIKPLALLACAIAMVSPVAEAAPSVAAHPPLQRLYREGQTIALHMTAQNESWSYSADATATVQKDDKAAFFEDFAWSNLVSDGKPVPLSPAMTAYRQRLSLDPNHFPSAPDLSGVDPRMIGPVTDLLTFYADLWLAAKFNTLHAPGDHFYFPNPMTPSWADGTRVILGEDSIDFDMTLKSVANDVAVLEVRHVPPKAPKVHLPAPWMQAPVGTGANNWVEVTKNADGTFTAAVGEETFDVLLTVSVDDGRILKAVMTNPVTTIVRTCRDAAFTDCDAAKPRQILRTVQVAALR